MAMSHIFISYSKRNKPYARRLADHMIASGFDVWIDDRIDYGSLWVDVIQRAIEDCAAFVVIMTPEARESQWVQTECEYATQKEKQVFPLLLEGDVFFRYVSVQYVNVTDGSLPPDAFLDEVGEYAPRKRGRGEDVTAPEASEAQRPPAVLNAQQPSHRTRTRAPLLVGAGTILVMLLVALALALQNLPGDDPEDESTQDEVGQAATPTRAPTPRVTREPGDCRYDWFFGNDYALEGDCPASEAIEFEGVIQNFGEGVLIGLYVSDGRFFILNNDGQYFDIVAEWDTSLTPVGACALQTVYGLSGLMSDDETADEILGCPNEPVNVETLSYQASDTHSGFVVYIGIVDAEAYRLHAPTSRAETEGEWQRVR